ncbi:hypothetical protein [Yoonia sp. R2-816]|uniref:hypothetical protein n=1 Tax=Yoonia sp. R2-816 TaxID=3342638 RepID=UPI00372C4825
MHNAEVDDRFAAEAEALQTFTKLARNDQTLRMHNVSADQLFAKQLTPTSYDRQTLFHKMARQEPALFDDFPDPLQPTTMGVFQNGADGVVKRLLRSESTDSYPVRFGRGDSQQHLTISEIMRRWRASGTVLGITDLPVRTSDLGDIFDQDFLAPWNMMPLASAPIKELEMLTSVISTAGKLTDSHSDDMAVCNHCFVGKKLWFAWDTYEGLEAGIEDVERVEVQGRAAFSLEQFLTLDEAFWFFVEPGETIFLPGKYTHRVYTLEDYIGVGSFYVSLLNVLHTASRWHINGSLWDKDTSDQKGQLVDDLFMIATECLAALDDADPELRQAWGCDAIPDAIRHWENAYAPRVTGRPSMKAFVGAMKDAAQRS